MREREEEAKETERYNQKDIIEEPYCPQKENGNARAYLVKRGIECKSQKDIYTHR